MSAERAACSAISEYPSDTDHPMAVLARYAIRDLSRRDAHLVASRHEAYRYEPFADALDRIEAARVGEQPNR